jgi:hypothetical protein
MNDSSFLTFTATIQGIQRMLNSHDGCPRYRVFTPTGTYTTEPNAQVNFLLPNYRGERCVFTLNVEGRIIGVESAKD